MNRASRKRAKRLAETAQKELTKVEGSDLKAVSNRLDLAHYKETLEQLLQGGEASAVVPRTATQMHRQTEENTHETAPRYISRQALDGIDCRQGCAWCCHEPLQVSILDAIAVAHYLRNQGRADEVRTTLEQHIEDKLGHYSLHYQELKRSFDPCPFLNDDNLCSVYEARPVICRAFHSTDVTVCEKNVREKSASRSVPMYSPYFGFIGLAQEGARRAVRDLGLDDRPVVLAIAVKLLLSDFEGLVSGWLDGERVFDEAAVIL